MAMIATPLLLQIALFALQTESANDALPSGAIARIRIREAKYGSPDEPSITSVKYSPDGSTLATGSSDKSIRLWDPRTGKQALKLEGHEAGVTSIAFLSDGTLASGSKDGTVRMWEISTGKLIRRMATPSGVLCLASASRRPTLAAGCQDNSILAWDPATGKVLFDHRNSPGPVGSLASSPDGKALVSTHDNSFFCHLWDGATGKKIREFQWENPVAILFSAIWSPDGKRVAAGAYGSLRIWDVETGAHSLECIGQPGDEPAWFNHSIAFSPDGKLLAAGSDSSGVRIWDAAKGTHLVALKGDLKSIEFVSFSPDGKQIASADNRSIMIWDLAAVMKK
jgi:WD40 repeat protein